MCLFFKICVVIHEQYTTSLAYYCLPRTTPTRVTRTPTDNNLYLQHSCASSTGSCRGSWAGTRSLLILPSPSFQHSQPSHSSTYLQHKHQQTVTLLSILSLLPTSKPALSNLMLNIYALFTANYLHTHNNSPYPPAHLSSLKLLQPNFPPSKQLPVNLLLSYLASNYCY